MTKEMSRANQPGFPVCAEASTGRPLTNWFAPYWAAMKRLAISVIIIVVIYYLSFSIPVVDQLSVAAMISSY